MARARSLRVVSNPAWCRIFRENVSPVSILGHYFDVVSFGKALYPHMLHLTQA